MNIKRFNESKKDEEVFEFDIKSFEDDKEVVGFARDTEEMQKNAENKLKKEIQNDGGTPGLKTAIKKFEDFSVKIIIDEEGSDNEEECCSSCNCNPCGCEVEVEGDEVTGEVNNTEVANVIPFMDFLKNIR